MTITITPLANDTRLRNMHSTKGDVISLHDVGAVVLGDEIWLAKVTATDGSNTRAGDKWLLVNNINGTQVTGWMAIIHNGAAICKIMETTITPLKNETRLRDIHSTNGAVISSHDAGSIVVGDDVWTAETNARDGSNTKAGDRWLLVKSINGIPAFGWMAIVHNNTSICKVLETTTSPVIVPPAEPPANADDVVKILYSDVLCVMGDGSQKTFRLTPLP
jgi:hypothetical protein